MCVFKFITAVGPTITVDCPGENKKQDITMVRTTLIVGSYLIIQFEERERERERERELYYELRSITASTTPKSLISESA
jgi:hypothetical protein